MSPRALPIAAFVLVFALTRGAHADEPRTDPRARAQQLFDSALEDAEAGRFSTACPKFLASQEADPKTSTLLNLANCYERNGQTASAWGAFREAEGLARKAGRSDWFETARARADALEPKLVRLTILVPEPSRLDGLVVQRDGVRLPPGEWGVAIPVDPGKHVVVASAEGHRPWQAPLDVAAAETIEVPLLEPLPAPAPTPAPPLQTSPPKTEPTPWRTVGLVGGGVGVAALVAGGIVGLVAKGAYDDARSRCLDGATGCPASAVEDADAAYGTATGATVLAIGGAALTVAGVLVYFLAPSSRTTVHVGSRGVLAVF